MTIQISLRTVPRGMQALAALCRVVWTRWLTRQPHLTHQKQGKNDVMCVLKRCHVLRFVNPHNIQHELKK